jgi:PPOX class probable FMN-dependent enzyme
MSTTDSSIGFRDVVASLDELVAVHGQASDAVKSKIVDHLDIHCRSFITRSPFFLLATCDADGRCDVSPRGGPSGFVEVVDAKRLVFADAKGNKLADSLRNICQTGRAGMLFLIPGLDETLRVNGRACITRDHAILERHVVQEGRPPVLAIGVEVEEAFLHCAKAFIRSDLWEPQSWPSVEGMARPAQIWKDHMTLESLTLQDVEELVEDSYQNELY